MKKILSQDTSSIDMFLQILDEYKERIDTRIKEYIPLLSEQIDNEFGLYPEEAFKPFASYMSRGGKRIRGSLTMLSYEMYGGKDMKMITNAAMAIEMLQSYLLMMDDIQDRSDTRRGGPAAHIMLRDYHKNHFSKGDPYHFGVSIAMNSYNIGCHAALGVITSLDVEPSIVIKALNNIHKCYIITSHGQTMDIFGEVTDGFDEEDINNVLLWKTAYYTFLNPLQFGAILAGANERDLSFIYEYSIPAGKAFQITDDILGTFGNEFESGKSPMDDIRDGKKTILITKALEMSNESQAKLLNNSLGKSSLTMDELRDCQRIIEETGALEYAKGIAEDYVTEAAAALLNIPQKCSQRHAGYLKGLAQHLLVRKS